MQAIPVEGDRGVSAGLVLEGSPRIEESNLCRSDDFES